MRDVEFSASRENIRSKGLMQRFLSTIPQKGLCRTDRYLPLFAPLVTLSVLPKIVDSVLTVIFARKAPNPTEIPNFCRSDPFP